MSRTAIRVEGLAKQYRIGAPVERYPTLRDRLAQAAATPFRRLAALARGESAADKGGTLWALRDVSFEIQEGEVLGVIGANGAGKTTLLKILSRITEPTEGRARVRGRVGSLLEVGTGFHPELTGRENVYLNGAILGMPRTETARKLDSILEFSGIGQYLDTPVKHFSSGMYLRLAFAVAAHLDPDILLVDEVLAVGDTSFQRKCIASIRETTTSGRTAIVVSHNLAIIRSLCSRALLLDHGRVAADGEPEDVIQLYLADADSAEGHYRAAPEEAHKPLKIQEITLLDALGNRSASFPSSSSIAALARLSLRDGHTVQKPWVGFRIFTAEGDLLAYVGNLEAGYEFSPLEGDTTVRCTIEVPNLQPGEYRLGMTVADHTLQIHDHIDLALSFRITEADVFRTGFLTSSRHGRVYLQSRWEADPWDG